MTTSAPSSIRLVRAKTFSAAYRSFDPSMTHEENESLYGSRARAPGFGFNFVIEAHIEGEVDPLTGMIVNLVDLDRWLGEIAGELDHQLLHELAAFAGHAVTLERIAAHCANGLIDRMERDKASARLFKVRIHEGADLWVDCFSSAGNVTG